MRNRIDGALRKGKEGQKLGCQPGPELNWLAPTAASHRGVSWCLCCCCESIVCVCVSVCTHAYECVECVSEYVCVSVNICHCV